VDGFPLNDARDPVGLDKGADAATAGRRGFIYMDAEEAKKHSSGFGANGSKSALGSRSSLKTNVRAWIKIPSPWWMTETALARRAVSS